MITKLNNTAGLKMWEKNGQSILEYAVIISVICAVFLTMSAYTKRAVQSKFMTIQNRLNDAAR